MTPFRLGSLRGAAFANWQRFPGCCQGLFLVGCCQKFNPNTNAYFQGFEFQGSWAFNLGLGMGFKRISPKQAWKPCFGVPRQTFRYGPPVCRPEFGLQLQKHRESKNGSGLESRIPRPNARQHTLPCEGWYFGRALHPTP